MDKNLESDRLDAHSLRALMLTDIKKNKRDAREIKKPYREVIEEIFEEKFSDHNGAVKRFRDPERTHLRPTIGAELPGQHFQRFIRESAEPDAGGNYLAEPIIPTGGSVLSYGPPKQLKSWTGALAVDVASGARNALGHFPIPERDRLQMKINNRHKVSFSWVQAEKIAAHLQNMNGLGDARRKQYVTLVLLAEESGLPSSEQLALKVNDADFEAGTVRVDESSDQRTNGRMGPCKNAAAYRTVVLDDLEGRKAMQALRRFLENSGLDELIFRSRRGGPLLQTTVLNQGLYPALKALGLPKGGLHGFRRGCNRRWELAKLSPAIIRQQMGILRAHNGTLQRRNPARSRQAGIFCCVQDGIGK